MIDLAAVLAADAQARELTQRALETLGAAYQSALA
jgi:hypothetical protein